MIFRRKTSVTEYRLQLLQKLHKSAAKHKTLFIFYVTFVTVNSSLNPMIKNVLNGASMNKARVNYKDKDIVTKAKVKTITSQRKISFTK